MPYDKLLAQRRIKPYRAKPQEVERLLQVATRDLVTAERILPDDLDWSFNIVYNAVLQAGRALMLHKGFRPRGPEQHRTVVRFCELTLPHLNTFFTKLLSNHNAIRHILWYNPGWMERAGVRAWYPHPQAPC
jgi:uncharacterized protein (UPF0332 family)